MVGKNEVTSPNKVSFLPVGKVEKEEITPPKISEKELKLLSQNLTPNFRSEVIKTSQNYKFKEMEGINELARLQNIYKRISTVRLKEHEDFAVMLRMFAKYKKLIELATLWFCRERAKSPFMGTVAKDEEITMTAINTESLDKPGEDRIYQVDMGDNPKVFNKTFDKKSEMCVILGLQVTTNPRVVERARIKVTEKGQPITASRMRYGDMGIMEIPGGPIAVRDGQTLNIDLDCSRKASTDFWVSGVWIGKSKEISLIKP